MALVDINLPHRFSRESKRAIRLLSGKRSLGFDDCRRPMTTEDTRKRELSSNDEDRRRIRLQNVASIESGCSLASRKGPNFVNSCLVELGDFGKAEFAENGSKVTMHSQGQQAKIEDFDSWDRIVSTQILHDDPKGMFGSARFGEKPRSHKGLLTDLRKAVAGMSVDRQIEETLDFAEVVLARVSKVNAALATIPPVQEKRPDLYSIYLAEMAKKLVNELDGWVGDLPKCISLYHIQLLDIIEETKELRARCAATEGKFKELTAEKDLLRRKLSYFLQKSKFDQADVRADLLGIPSADRAKLDAEYEDLFHQKPDFKAFTRNDGFSTLVARDEAAAAMHARKSLPLYLARKAVVPPEQQLEEMKALVDNLSKAVHSAEAEWSISPIRDELREVLKAAGVQLSRQDSSPDQGKREAKDEKPKDQWPKGQWPQGHGPQGQEPKGQGTKLQPAVGVDTQLGFDRRTIQRLVQESLEALKEIQSSLGDSYEGTYVKEVHEFLHAVAHAQRRFDLPVGVTRPNVPLRKSLANRHMTYDVADNFATAHADSPLLREKKKLDDIPSTQVVTAVDAVADKRQGEGNRIRDRKAPVRERDEEVRALDVIAPSQTASSDFAFSSDEKPVDACLVQPMYPEGTRPEGQDSLWGTGETLHAHSQSLNNDPRGVGRPVTFEFDGSPVRHEVRPATQGSPATDGGTEMRSGAAFTPERITAQAKAFGPLNLYRAICSVDDVRLRNAILGALEPYRYHLLNLKAGPLLIVCRFCRRKMDPDATAYVLETSPRRVQSMSRIGTPARSDAADTGDIPIPATREKVVSDDPFQVHRIEKGRGGDEKSLVDNKVKRFNENRKVGLPSVLRNKVSADARCDGCSRSGLSKAEAKVIRMSRRRLLAQ